MGGDDVDGGGGSDGGGNDDNDQPNYQYYTLPGMSLKATPLEFSF